MTSRFFASFAELLLRRRVLVGILVSLVTVASIMTFGSFRVNSRNEIWFVENDPQLLVLEKFERIFQNDDFVYLLVQSEDFFNEEILRRFGSLAEDLERTVPFVADATWLGSAEYIEGRADDVVIDDVMPSIPTTAEEMAEMRRRAFAEPLFINSLISEDGKTAGLLLEMGRYPNRDEFDGDPRKLIGPAVREVLARPEYDGLELLVTGSPLIDEEMDHLVAREMTTLMLGCVLVQMLILFWVGRGWRGVVVPLLVVNLSVAWTFGAIWLYGYELNVMVAMVPLLLVCVGIGDSMHLISEFQDRRDAGLEPRDALIAAFSHVGLACVLTSLTTAAGFLSFLAAPVRPYRELGVYSATGAVCALLLTFLIVPLFYVPWRTRSEQGSAIAEDQREAPKRQWLRPGRQKQLEGHGNRDDAFDRLLSSVHALVVRRPRTIVAVFTALAALAMVGVQRVEIQSSTIKLFSPRVQLRQTYERVDEMMGGTMAIEIMFDTGEPNRVIEPEFLRKMERIEKFIKDYPRISQTASVLDIMRQMRRAFHENRQEYYALPETREEVSQYLLLYELSGGENKEKFLTYEYDVARLTARTRSLDSRDVEQFLDAVQAEAEAVFGEDADSIQYTGFMAFLGVMAKRIATGQERSFAAAALVITVIMILLLRSIRTGLISMIPNIFPVLMTLGLMGMTGIYLDLGLMSVSAIIIGVAVDDTIHFFLRLRREFAQHQNYSAALERTYDSVGRPIVFTTVTLTIGFSVLMISNVTGMVKFGMLAGYAFSWALLADFLFAPALVLLTRPLGPERN